jgi:predicted TIM-barrel fold metal-dependent hydrolase
MDSRCAGPAGRCELNQFNRLVFFVFAMVCVVVCAIKLSLGMPASPGPGRGPEAADLSSLSALNPIDTHIHIFEDSPDIYAMLDRLNMRAVNICVVSRHDDANLMKLEPEFQMDLTVHEHSRGRAAICTTFDPYNFEDPHFASQAIAELNDNFRAGAVAVKIWKNVGMEIQWPSGKYVLPDDPIFEPIYKDIASHNKTLIAHLAEPDSSWESFEQMGSHIPDYGYYKQHPFWHMYGKPGAPTKAQILTARDHLLEQNPHLRVIGAHLGSMEVNVDEIARRFDRYPNFAVDTAARVHYLMAQPGPKVRAFLIKYQDRVVYGTDGAFRPSGNLDGQVKGYEDRVAVDWKYFSTDETFQFRGMNVQGLKLPQDVLKKLYHDNAVKWIPGVLGSAGEASR